ncbi:MAG: proton-conducting transporter membrane subunit [candidate division WOR-3 bacterium]
MNNLIFFLPVLVSFLGGVILFFLPPQTQRFKRIFNLIISLVLFIIGIKIFLAVIHNGSYVLTLSIFNISLSFMVSFFASLVLMVLFSLTLLVAIFSLNLVNFVIDEQRFNKFYAYFQWTLTASSIVLLTDNLVVLLVFWGAIAILLYLLILMGKPGASQAAYKTLVMIGGSDVLMLIGAALVYYLAGSATLSDIRLSLNSSLSILAFILLLIGVLTKSGAVPFHTWIVDASESAPSPVLVLYPGIIDKVLGIYLLTRLCLDWFTVYSGSAMSIVLMSIGGLTVIIGSAMALVSKNLLRLLAYSTISQVGYMVLGIGSALPLGIIGAIFHMFNNTIYKSSLFFTAGVVEAQGKETDFLKLGGLARFMPITFITSFIAALAISGVPPLNGFFSKLLIYQGIINIGSSPQGWYFVIFIIAAMFGSVLTLAYFLKMIYAVFLAPRAKNTAAIAIKEPSWSAILPMLVLSILAIGFGVYAKFPLSLISKLSFQTYYDFTAELYPVVNAKWAVVLIISAIIIGLIIYFMMKSKRVKESAVFIGGEAVSPDKTAVSQQEASYSGADFYESVKDMKIVADAYRVADKKVFDIFEQGKNLIGQIVKVGKKIHSGLLQTYLGWLFLGVIAIIAIFFFLLLR